MGKRPRQPRRLARPPDSSNRWHVRLVPSRRASFPTDSPASATFAQAIARAERELGGALNRQAESEQATGDANSPLADRQRELADDAAALADVLEQLKATARVDDRELAQSIAQADRRTRPGEIEQSMRQNAEAIGSGQTEQAAAGSPSPQPSASRRSAHDLRVGPPRSDRAPARAVAGSRERQRQALQERTPHRAPGVRASRNGASTRRAC